MAGVQEIVRLANRGLPKQPVECPPDCAVHLQTSDRHVRVQAGPYGSFAEFFDREFLTGARRFPAAPEQMGAFSEARYFAWEKLALDQKFPVKGHSLSAAHILGSEQRAEPYVGGPMVLARLAPVDS